MEEVINDILEMARRAAPVVDELTGTKYASAAVSAANAIGTLIDNIKETASETDQAKLQQTRDELEKSVLAHADRTIDNLGD